MKASEIRELSLEEMIKKAEDLREELFNLRFQHGSGQLENPQKMKEAKKDVAKIETIIRETARKQKTEKE
jgi:large subunit ribosomal protein L29